MTSNGHPGDTIDDQLLERIRALLAKAESSGYPAEAEAFMGKAQSLMASHSIDVALLSEPGSGGPEVREVRLEAPYTSAKSQLLGAVAHSNRCHVVYSPYTKTAHVVGHPADLEAVELLFTSLLVQAVANLQRLGTRVDPDGRSRTKSFRRAFLLGFAGRIGQRLAESARRAEEAARSEYGSELAPVLQGRDDAVSETLHRAFPFTRSTRSTTTNSEGVLAGRRAADTADVGTGRVRGHRQAPELG